jgi:hypothetical protein
MRSRLLASLVSAVLVAGGVAACGGSGGSGNGVAAKSADGIVAAAAASVKGVTAFRISGTVASGGQQITLDLSLVAGKGASGTLTENGLSFKLIAIGKTIYINGSPGFWRHFGGAAAATLFQGKWLKAPLGSGNFASLSSLTNAGELFNKLLDTHGTLKKVGQTTIAGQKVVGVRDLTKGGTLYVATNGPAYPIEIVSAGADQGHVSFGDFGQSTALTAPAGAIDISQLKG